MDTAVRNYLFHNVKQIGKISRALRILSLEQKKLLVQRSSDPWNSE